MAAFAHELARLICAFHLTYSGFRNVQARAPGPVVSANIKRAARARPVPSEISVFGVSAARPGGAGGGGVWPPELRGAYKAKARDKSIACEEMCLRTNFFRDFVSPVALSGGGKRAMVVK